MIRWVVEGVLPVLLLAPELLALHHTVPHNRGLPTKRLGAEHGMMRCIMSYDMGYDAVARKWGEGGGGEAPTQECFGSTSQDDVPLASLQPRRAPRGLDPGIWLAQSASPTHRVATRRSAAAPNSRVPPPHAQSRLEWNPPYQCLGTDSLISPFPASGIRCHGVDSRGFR